MPKAADCGRPPLIDPIQVLRFAAPVALGATGETVNQKAGTLNIGLEGMMLLGTFFAFRVADVSQSVWLGLAAAIGTGIMAALLAGWFVLWQQNDQIVIGTAINLLALGITGTLYRNLYGASGILLSVPKLPKWGGLDPVLIFMTLSIPVVWALLQRSPFGLLVRAAGEEPKAVETAGYKVLNVRLVALLFAGAYAGLAGGYLALGINGAFSENCTVGRGFVAIAMVTFGRWNPFWVFAASMLIGLIESFQFSLQSSAVPFQLLIALPYVVALGFLIISKQKARGPHALGVPFVENLGEPSQDLHDAPSDLFIRSSLLA